MDVSVVITCWNGKKILEKNLPAVIKAAKNPRNRIKEILVVDDASLDDSVKFLEENFSEVKVIRQPKNFGYAVTCNTGVKMAQNELVAILNLDVIPSVNFLEDVFPLFENEKVFAVSFNEGQYGPGRLVWEEGFLQIKKEEPSSKTIRSSWPSGGSAVFRKEIWQKLGGMDTVYLPFYFEDIDLGLRAAKAGFECLWEPKAKVSHEHEATINPKNFKQSYVDLIKQRNHLLLTWKNIDCLGLLGQHLYFLFKRCLKGPGYLRVVAAAVVRSRKWLIPL
jgi:GT2 family glycosyltransferase